MRGIGDFPVDYIASRLPAAHRVMPFVYLALLPLVVLAAFVATTWAASMQADLFDVPVNQVRQADQHEPSLAVSPLDPKIVLAAAKDWRTGPKQVWYYRSTDGGRSWKDGNIVGMPTELPNQSDPVVNFDAAGAAYLTFIGYNQNDLSVGGIFIARSDDGGATWAKPILVSANSDKVFNDKEWVAIDRSGSTGSRGTIYVTWTLFKEEGLRDESATIVVSRSTDGGRSFSTPRNVSPADHTTNQGSYPVVGPGGELYVLYYRDVPGANALYIAKSTDRGITFPQVVKAADVARPPSPLPGNRFRIFVLPSLSVDAASGNLYATWNDFAAGNSDVKLVSSTDGGATWSAARRVNGDRGTANQFFPAAAVGANGALHLVWLDMRDDPSGQSYAPYYARSLDGGQTLPAEFRISREMSEATIGFEGTLLGDYIALDTSSDGGTVYAAWVDTRNGDQDIYFASFDARSTSGPVSAATPRPTPAVGAAGLARPSPQPLTGFTSDLFRSRWERADKPVLNASVARPWTWGPVSFAAAIEPYAEGDEGQREVQYFDKARMELNRGTGDTGSGAFITNGLLVVELVSGTIQNGDRLFAPPRTPSEAVIAGDATAPDALTYKSLGTVASLNGDRRAPDRTGQPVNAVLSRSGAVRDDPGRTGQVRMGRYEPVTGHNIADVFWTYLNSVGPVYNSRFGTVRDEPVLDWLSDVGYPISEPYWTNTRIGGSPRWVLVQAYQRRVLTYVAENPPGWQVEMGNVGRHYFDWRYGGLGAGRR